MEFLGPPNGEENQNIFQDDEAAHDDEHDRVRFESRVLVDITKFPSEVVVSGD